MDSVFMIMKTIKLKIDFEKEKISKKIKSFILEQASLIERLYAQIKALITENAALKAENEELKKNFK
jgi:regulator of replication initiation timing